MMNGDFDSSMYTKDVIHRFEGVLSNIEKIDETISQNLIRYTIDRLNLVDLAILRNSVFEFLYTKLPVEIIINEAIILTKKYSNLDDDSAKRFNNKLLDNIMKAIKK